MAPSETRLGLRENLGQFALLVLINAFVGGMVGMERSIFPAFASQQFGLSSHTALLSFIVAFGLTKAIANYFTGKLANRIGRRNTLLMGWALALPIPFMLLAAPSWNWVIFANILLGISQGLTWSSTVVMKIDLVGEKDRGFAMGLNEFAGYLAVGLVAFLTGYLASHYGVTPYPFYLGIAIAFLGFFLTLFWVKDTLAFVKKEGQTNTKPPLKNVFWDTTLRDKTLSAVTQAGMVNNLNDGMIWGLFPVLLGSLQFGSDKIGILTATYPMVWGISQLLTGKMADWYSKKRLLFGGMLLQALAILILPFTTSFGVLLGLAVLLGLGTALVYPTFLTTLAAHTSAEQRAESIGVFRWWRDLGYALGALLSGITADYFGIHWAILLIGGLTLLSALVIKIRMPGSERAAKTCISQEEAQHWLQDGQPVLLLDVRGSAEYEQGHIPNAIHLSLNALPGQLDRLDKQQRIITICGNGGGRSSKAAQLLQSMGFRAYWLCGGTTRWLAPMESFRTVCC